MRFDSVCEEKTEIGDWSGMRRMAEPDGGPNDTERVAPSNDDVGRKRRGVHSNHAS